MISNLIDAGVFNEIPDSTADVAGTFQQEDDEGRSTY
jgi:hypothetical protein